MNIKKILFLIIALFSAVNTYSQENISLVPFVENGVWGYMNFKKIIKVTPQFQEAFPLVNDVGRFKKNGKFGYINKEGKVIVKAKYNNAKDFSHGYAEVVKGRKKFYINTSGKKVKTFFNYCGFFNCYESPKIVDSSFKFSNNYIGNTKIILDSLFSYADTIYDISNYLFIAIKDDKIDIIDGLSYVRDSNSVIYTKRGPYNFIRYFPCEYNSNTIKTYFGICVGKLWGYLFTDYQSLRIIEPKYLSINSFEDQLAMVQFELGRFGYIDKDGIEYFYRTQN